MRLDFFGNILPHTKKRGLHQYIVSSLPSDPSSRAVSKAVIAELGISVPTILLLLSSFSLTTCVKTYVVIESLFTL